MQFAHDIYLQKIKQYSFQNKLNAAKQILNLCSLIIARLKLDFPKDAMYCT
jgi:hypothetical protein